MNILIAGCGKIGTAVLSDLVSEGHDVTALDTDPAVLSDLSNIYDVMTVCGNVGNCEILGEAGVSHTDLFIAATGSDEANLLGCFLAKRLGAAHTIARVRNPEHNERNLRFMKQQLDLSMLINPEMMAAGELCKLLKFPSAIKIETFSRLNFEMVELRLKPDSVLDGVRIIDLRSRSRAKFLICVVQRGDEVFIPDGQFVLHGGDRIGITATLTEIQKLLREIGLMQKQCRRVMLLGGSRTAIYLARMLSESGISVKIIEKDERLCRELCETLPKTVIVQGDGARQELLLEEGLPSQDAFLALTGMDEENILISFFAASMKVPKVISKVNRSELVSIAEQLGLDSLISPQKYVSDLVVRYARALQNSLDSNIETLYQLMDGKAEALEFIVGSESSMLGVTLRDLTFKPNILIAGIIRNRQAIIPGGDDVILPGDRVVVLAADRKLRELSDILR